MMTEEESSAERSKKRAQEAAEALQSSSDESDNTCQCNPDRAIPDSDRRGEGCIHCQPDGGDYSVGPQEDEEKKPADPTPEELANMQLQLGLQEVAGVKPGEEPTEAQQQYMDYLEGIADEKGDDGKSARDEMVMDNEDAQAEAAEKYAAFKQQNPGATMDDFYDHNNQELANQESKKANAALAMYQDEAHQQGDGRAKIDNAEQGEFEPDEFSGEQHRNIGGGNQDDQSAQGGDNNQSAGKDATDDKKKKGSEQVKGKQGEKDGKGQPPKEGWFVWLRDNWATAVRTPMASAPCSAANKALYTALSATGVGAVLLNLPIQLISTIPIPFALSDCVGWCFGVLNALENDPLFYSTIIFTGLNAGLPIAGPIIFGGPAIFAYTGIQPVRILRELIDKILKFPIMNGLLLTVKSVLDEVLKGDKSAFSSAHARFKQGGIKEAARGAVSDKVEDAKTGFRDGVNAVKDAPRKTRDKAQGAYNSARNAPSDMRDKALEQRGAIKDYMDARRAAATTNQTSLITPDFYLNKQQVQQPF